ncbi:hypothetical protein MSP8886_02799 [Marinomonas spartinae]|uniref:Lipoprotein n=1 Tax=Marinomonas spartinae TaxID=1792290 RepID=A0A1A8TLD8_9GAMM|nr:hypothetical protein [Marinomonas spartinae]SBS33573.1 hypothetical protein MSP8886_02799 [Marinomonas spartinae]
MLGRSIFCLLLMCCLSSCAIRDAYPNARNPIDVSQVIVFNKPPRFSYEVIGSIRSPALDTFDRQTIVASAVKGLKEKAAALGANGVIVGDTDMFLAAYIRASTGTYFFRGMPWMWGRSEMDGFYRGDGFPPVQLSGEAIFYSKKKVPSKNDE